MRCFVAIELTPELRRALVEMIGRSARTGDAVRWCRGDQLHLTLRFLGELSDGAVERARTIVGEVSASRPPFELSLGGLGCFPPRGPGRVLWCGVEDASGGCAGWVRAAEPRWRELDVPPEERFSAHVTLARAKSPAGGARIREVTVGAVGPERARMRVEAVTLLESRLESGGARYRIIEAAPLAG